MSESTLSQYIANTINEAGIKHVFVYPGDPIIDLLEALRASGVDVVLAQREGTAAIMAEAAGMLTGLPGVCISTLGPGSTAMVGGVASAHLDRAPILALSGQINRARETFFTHQVVDHERLYAPITKWAGHIEPGSAATVMRKALRTAAAERPGAVHVTMHDDNGRTKITDHTSMLPPLGMSQAVHAGFSLTGGVEADVKSRLAKARRPMIIAGASVVRTGAVAQLKTLAESGGIPVVTTPMAKGAFDETHELFAGVADMACAPIVWDFLRSSDLLLLVGFDGVELIAPWSVQIPAIHIDATPNTDQIYEADIEIVGDMSSAMQWMSDNIGEPRFTGAEVAKHRANLREGYLSGRVSDKLNPTDVVETVRATASDSAICTSDVGSHKLLVGQGWTTTAPYKYLVSNGLSAMGFAIPSAIAAAMITPDPVYSFVGDGGFAMAATELALAAERHLPMTVIVLRDKSLNRIELKQQVRKLPSTATVPAEIDAVQVAMGLGCDGVRAENIGELEKCLAEGPKDRPLVIEVPIDPSQYLAQFS